MSLAKEFLSGTKRRTSLIPLPMGRLQVKRWFDLSGGKEQWSWHEKFGKDIAEGDQDLTIKVFGGFGLLDGADNLNEALGAAASETLAGAYTQRAYRDCRLVHEECDPTKAEFHLYQVYETLTGTWELEDKDKRISTENGLRLLTRTQVAMRGTAPPFTSADVGAHTSIDDAGKTLYLAGVEDLTDDRKGKILTRWAEAGVLNKSESGGPASLPGTIRHTWECFVANPAIAADMGGAANTIPGIPTGRTQSKVEGIPTWRYTSIAFPSVPVDNKYLLLDYYTPRNVTRAGRIGIGLYADVPYLKIDPKSDGKEDVKVNLYVTTVKPTKVGTVAETLKGLKVGVTHLRTEIRPIGSDSYTSPSGNMTATAAIYRHSNSPSYKAMTGYYIDPTFGTGVSGNIYTVSYPAAIIRDGDNIVGETIDGLIKESYTLEGSGSADAPPAVGVYDRGIDVAFTALDGTVYYVVEEIILEVAA